MVKKWKSGEKAFGDFFFFLLVIQAIAWLIVFALWINRIA